LGSGERIKYENRDHIKMGADRDHESTPVKEPGDNELSPVIELGNNFNKYRRVNNEPPCGSPREVTLIKPPFKASSLAYKWPSAWRLV